MTARGLARTTLADEEGRFRFEDLPGGEPWFLTAGDGDVLTPEGQTVYPGCGPATLRAGWLYATTLRIRAQGGGALQVDPGLYQDTTNPVEILMEGVGGVRRQNPALRLLGIDPDTLEPLATRFDRSVLLIGVEPLEEVGPIRIHAAAPGYVTHERTVSVPRWKPGAADEQLIELVQSTAGWGSLSVVFEHPTNFLEGGGRASRPAARIKLRSLDGGKPLSFSMWSMTDHTRVLNGVPAGSYFFDWHSGNGFSRLTHLERSQLQRIDVYPEQETVVLADTGRVSTVTFSLRGPQGAAYEQGAKMILRRVAEEHGDNDLACDGSEPTRTC